MRILQLCNKVPWPPDDGGRIAMLNMAKGFVENGNEVFILGMNTDKHKTVLEDIPADFKSRISFNIVNVSAKISFLGTLSNFIFSRTPYTATRFYSKDYENALICLLQDNHFDVVQFEGLYLLSYLDIVRKYSNSLISFRAHNIEHEIWERTAVNEPSLLRRIYLNSLIARIRRFKASFLNKYDVLIPITDRDNVRFLELGNIKPSFVSQTGLDMNDYQIVDGGSAELSVFHIGALDWAPNQEGLVWFIDNVWSELQLANKKIEFCIAGRNAPIWLEDKFSKTVGVKYLGEVENAIRFMDSNNIMVVPLLSGSGMRIKIIEGMALGKCIVSTSIGVEGIDITNNENIIIADNANDFIGQVLSLISDNDKRLSISLKAKEFIKYNFDNTKICKDLLNFYENEINSIDAN